MASGLKSQVPNSLRSMERRQALVSPPGKRSECWGEYRRRRGGGSSTVNGQRSTVNGQRSTVNGLRICRIISWLASGAISKADPIE